MKTDMFMLPKEKEELEWLLHVLRIAIDRFNEMESFLLKNGHSEQCLCARLALHLENALHTADKSGIYQGYVADIEYNRGMHLKESATKNIGSGSVRLDIAVHQRELDTDHCCYHNLICVEMKKNGSKKKDREKDLQRLVVLTNNTEREPGQGMFCFHLGAFLVADKHHLYAKYIYSSLLRGTDNPEITDASLWSILTEKR